MKFKKIILLSGVIFIFILTNFVFFHSNYQKKDLDWLDFNKINIKELIDQDNIVFVDITADWCATCQYNKINVINSEKITNSFKKNNVIKVRGDWTKPNSKIQQFLESNNKFGIPFNIIYNKENSNGIILSELLSTNEIVDIIDRLN